MAKPKLVVVLGAGASQKVGLPGTLDLSERVLEVLRDHDGYPNLDGPIDARAAHKIRAARPPRVEPLIDTIRRAGSENFETDMHALESLMTLAPHDPVERVMQRAIADMIHRLEPQDALGRVRQRPPIANLVQVLPILPALADPETLLSLMRDLAATVRAELETAEESIASTALEPLVRFFAALASHYDLSIYSFNYDGTARTAATRAIGPMEDGFAAVGGEVFERFDVRRFLDSLGPRYGYLHGALAFRVRARDLQKPTKYEVVKIPPGVIVPPGFSDIEEAVTQAADFAMIGSIITGLHKADKTRTEPYGTYAYALERDLYAAERIALIGYGAGDTYFNLQVLRAAAYHGARWKPVVITRHLPRPTEGLYALCGVMAGIDDRAFYSESHIALANGFGAVGSLHLDARGWLPADADQADSLLRALA
jgi:hypothetical protein